MKPKPNSQKEWALLLTQNFTTMSLSSQLYKGFNFHISTYLDLHLNFQCINIL